MKDWIEKVTNQPFVAHAMAANERYNKRLGPQFAAAVTYFSVLSMVPIVMFAFSMLGWTLTVLRPDLMDQIKGIIDAQLGEGTDLSKSLGAVVDHAFRNWASVGAIAVLTAAYSGSNWVGNLKRAVRVMWASKFSDASEKGNFFAELGVNLAIFVGLLVSVAASLTVSSVGGGFSRQVIAWLGWDHLPGIGFVFQAVAVLLTFIASWILLAFLFIVFPRQRATPRAWLTGTVLGAVLITVLQQLAGRLVGVFTGNPAASVFGPVIVLMLVFNLLATIILMSAAWIGTDEVWPADLARKHAERASGMAAAAEIDLDDTPHGDEPVTPRRWSATRSLDDLRRAQPIPPLSPDPERAVRQDVAGRSVRLGTSIGYGIGAATGLGLGAAAAALARRVRRRR